MFVAFLGRLRRLFSFLPGSSLSQMNHASIEMSVPASFLVFLVVELCSIYLTTQHLSLCTEVLALHRNTGAAS